MRPQGSRRRSSSKRSSSTAWEEEEATVDDLAHAATFAMGSFGGLYPGSMSAVPKDPGVPTNNVEEAVPNPENIVEEDIDVDSDSSSEEESDGEASAANPENDNDDDESEVDLVEALAQMEGDANAEDEEDEENPSSARKQAPKTENEVDAYSTPIQVLEQHLQVQLTVDTGSNGDSKSTNSLDAREKEKLLKPAGRVKHYMLLDRTVVVESSAVNPHGESKSILNSEPLDEGSLLVFRPPPTSKNFVPLGRILEVFGPVSQPLYTIRLPPPTSKESGEKTESSSKPTTEDSKVETNDKDPTLQGTEKDSNKKAVVSEGSMPPVDPWGPNGEYAKWLLDNPSLPVYYVQDDAKTIDTKKIMRTSGKGCDASNLYDEEVMHANEMYYSDDEEERQAKSKKRQSKNAKRSDGTGDRNPLLPSGFHREAPQQHLPHGFHQPSASLPQPSQRPIHPQAPGMYAPQIPPPPPQRPVVPHLYPHGYPSNMPPPPPPPPPSGHRQGMGAPPPPPPGGTAPPPAYQY